ncbi:MAG: glutamate--cysteine ligase [Oxalicibacterium faecigallinarum]|uniref:glutamate--cysteine ligase n=1 Tax=Oxalicibacterium faecigallinarum TaxID=573741 RepID=UPI002809151C|nr:glutamate--cysteine ligase [Oxalicibacterium faecigallinarum]MDQ7970136.1 glutamate--cysteine ligase [Oxalicibacterium faecigallinarum]
MNNLFAHRLSLLAGDAHRHLLTKGYRGIERETLRVTPTGHLALDAHPVSLGSALTHPQITTDYSESLLEFITPTEHDVADALAQLDKIHRFSNANIGDELLWSQSMPCILPAETEIPIAWYGTSHIGMIKHVYRRGLAVRYGKAMQCIAGLHYNYSLSEDLWRVLKADTDSPLDDKDFQSESYIALIRNFHRYSWLLMYLFGASPALSTQFLRGRPHQLDKLSDDTLYLPYATSLRMSDLGYQNTAQSGIMPPYNDLDSYMRSLSRAVRQPYPDYEAIGTRRNGEWIQLNTNLLQIENEFYATIRPKRVINSGERPVEALCTRGVQYIEVRCLDIDPFEPLGISLATSRFLDAFLLFCALDDSPPTDEKASLEATGNFARTVKEGRRPGLMLQRDGQEISLQEWGLTLLDRIQATATLLDSQCDDRRHSDALLLQKEKLLDADKTPSAKVLARLAQHGNSFTAFGLQQSRDHAAYFAARPLSAQEEAEFVRMSQASLNEQTQMEQQQSGDFDAFVAAYNQRTPSRLCG